MIALIIIAGLAALAIASVAAGLLIYTAYLLVAGIIWTLGRAAQLTWRGIARAVNPKGPTR